MSNRPRHAVVRSARGRRALIAAALASTVIAGVPVSADAAEPASDPHRSVLVGSLRDELRQYLAERGVPEHVSDVSLTVTYPGRRPGISLAAGTTQYGGGAPASAEAMWQIGSNTKAFTAVLLLQLEAEGRLSIDDTLGRWLPQYPEWSHVTIRQLLDMTSGIADYVSQPAFAAAVEADPKQDFSAPSLVAFVHGLPLGSGYGYSNTNYILAQLVVEKASHDSYADQLSRRILIPLGLRQTCYGSCTRPAGVASRMPTGYFDPSTPSPITGSAVPKLGLTWAQGAGAIVSSLQDMTTWDRALYQGRLLPARQQRELESLVSTKTGQPIPGTTADDPDGFGLGVDQVASPLLGTVWIYEGETFGYRVMHMYVPSTGIIVAVAANSMVDESTDELSALLVAAYETVVGKAPASLQDTKALPRSRS